MKILYLNNLRGFQNTFVPFLQVNFLVGENSTGKSTILSLLKLMSTMQFWTHADFNIGDLELGFYNELVTNSSKAKKSFQIGYHAGKELNNEPDRIFETFLVTYANDKGSPAVSEIRMLIDDYSILIKFSEKQTRYQIKRVTYKCNSIDSFKIWVGDKDFRGQKPTIVSSDNQILGHRKAISFYDIRSFLRSKLNTEAISRSFSRPFFLPVSIWMAPIRTKPKRIYESFKRNFSPEGDHTPLLIKSILLNQAKGNISRHEFRRIIEKFGQNSGLFDKIGVENLGTDLSAPFFLNVFLNGYPLKLTNVGYGVGQVLPLLAEILVAYEGRWFSIQQPEVHLHPKAQAALGDFLFDAVRTRSSNFLVETHSDFIIDRFRNRRRQSKTKIQCQVLFFERKKGGNIVTPIPIDSKGQYSDEQPKAFREFFINEELNLLAL